jgi:adenylate kinase
MLGPPGSGKGTCARIISKIYGIPHIATGDLLREVTAEGTERGRVAKEYIERGELVPDDITIGVMEERLSEPDCDEGFVLDGFPRNLRQADALDRILKEKGMSLTHVMNLVVDDEVIIGRLSLRRSCPQCGAVYHLKNNPPKRDEICDECGAKLVQRSDDTEEVLRHRLEVYEEKTRPLLERYREAGLARDMSGDLPIDEITEAVRRVLARD